MLKPKIQLFAEPADPKEPPEPEGNDPLGNAQEGADNEQSKHYAAAIRKILGLKEDEPLDNLDDKITDYQNKTELALKTANDRLIAAAINSLSGYDTRLLTKVMDMSQVTVNDKGEVVGITEAAAAAAKEFPAVVVDNSKVKDQEPFHPLGADDGSTVGKNMNDFIRAAAGRK